MRSNRTWDAKLRPCSLKVRTEGSQPFNGEFKSPQGHHTMKVYIATDIRRTTDQQVLAAKLLEQFDCHLTFDWTRHGTLAGRPHNEVSVDEIQAVLAADFVVVLLPGGRGTHTEMGVALGSGKRIFVHVTDESDLFGGYDYTCVFYNHPLVTIVYGTVDLLVTVIGEWLGK